MLGHADEIGRELRRTEPRAFPFRDGFAFLLETFLHHQVECFLLAHVRGVNALVQDGVADHP